MSQRSANLLHKKLSQLESELAEAFHFPPDSVSDQKTSRRLQKRFDYINNLLSAEVGSTPEKPDQLDDVGEKLGGLEAAFHCWSQYRDYALNMYHDEAPPQWVCPHCMDHHDDDVEDDGPGTALLVAEHFSDRKEEKKKSGRRRDGYAKLWGAFGSGVIVGAVWYTAIINYASLEYQDLYFIPPSPT